MATAIDEAVIDRPFRGARSDNGFSDESVSEAELRCIYDIVE